MFVTANACCTISVIGDRVTSPTWLQSQFMTLTSRMNHLAGIAHAHSLEGDSTTSHKRPQTLHCSYRNSAIPN